MQEGLEKVERSSDHYGANMTGIDHEELRKNEVQDEEVSKGEDTYRTKGGGRPPKAGRCCQKLEGRCGKAEGSIEKEQEWA